MTKKNYFQIVDRLRYNSFFFCRVSLILLLLFALLNQAKAQISDITVENIKFESEGIILAGTIYKPQHSHAGVVLVHGSDRTPRMGDFASLLAEKGISVLTYDKRGVGESGGIYAGPEVGTNNVDADNLNLLAEDAAAAIQVLHQKDKDIPIGLVGFSQAGWIIPIAAKKNLVADFMVLFSGAVISTVDQLIFQQFTNGKSDFWDTHTEMQVREYLPKIREKIQDDINRHQFVSTDPLDALSTLSIPGLWLFGEKDIQIPVGLSIERLNKLKAQGKPYEYCLFSALGHNVGFTEPINIAVHWIKNRTHSLKNK